MEKRKKIMGKGGWAVGKNFGGELAADENYGGGKRMPSSDATQDKASINSCEKYVLWESESEIQSSK
jgi:hypothetical protein